MCPEIVNVISETCLVFIFCQSSKIFYVEVVCNKLCFLPILLGIWINSKPKQKIIKNTPLLRCQLTSIFRHFCGERDQMNGER